MKKVLYILGELTDHDIEWLIENGRRDHISVGTALITENSDIEDIYLVLDGRFSITIDKGVPVEISRIGSGEVLGEISFVDSKLPSATVTATTPASVLSVPHDVLSDKLKKDDGFAARFYRALAVFLASRLRASDNRLGYNPESVLSEDEIPDEELDIDDLETISMAGARFERILKRLQQS